MDFNPNDIGNTKLNIFGLPFTEENAQLILLPVEWDTTTSYQRGTAAGPQAIFNASYQVDLYDALLIDAWKKGYYMPNADPKQASINKKLGAQAQKIINYISEGKKIESSIELLNHLKSVNSGCGTMVESVRKISKKILDKNKFVAIIGGEHSVPLGLMQALAEKHSKFGILHIDAHADLRNAYEGFEYSHASIIRNALEIKNVSKIVQVGIRDFCEDELELIKTSKKRIKTFFDSEIQGNKFNGKTWNDQCEAIINELPEKVYISFDIDGLDPTLCPTTGTPVPGGLQYYEAVYLLEKLAKSKKKIIGFDLCEVAPGLTEWDANVGARILFKLANCLAYSNKFKNVAE